MDFPRKDPYSEPVAPDNEEGPIIPRLRLLIPS